MRVRRLPLIRGPAPDPGREPRYESSDEMDKRELTTTYEDPENRGPEYQLEKKEVS